jgi:hypothetical protein
VSLCVCRRALLRSYIPPTTNHAFTQIPPQSLFPPLSFQPQAGEIATKHGFRPEEFDALLHKARGNPLFRWRVNRLMGPTPPAAFGNNGGGRGGAGAAFQF